VVDAAFGCGAHSEARIDAPSISAFVPSAVDELVLEVHLRPVPVDSGPGQVEVEFEVANAPASEAALTADAEGVEVDVDWSTVPAIDTEQPAADN